MKQMPTISKPVQNFFVVHFRSCHGNGTSASDPGTGIKVSTKPLSNETILVFHTDCDEGKACLGIRGKKVCDFIFYYTKGTDKEIICFLELKGTELDKAYLQVLDTNNHLKNIMQGKISDVDYQNSIRKICICLRHHAPSMNQKIRDKLIKIYGKNNVEIKHGVTRHDIGPLLRK